MTLYLLSLLPLLAGPLLVRAVSSRPGALALLDGVVVVGVGGLVLLHVLPGAIAEGGPAALLGALCGLVLPFFAGRLLHGRAALGRGLTLGVALLALALHALLDGVALSGHGQHQAHGTSLALAVVFHRLPVGIAIWRVVQPHHGRALALAVVGLIALATTVGTFGAAPLRPVVAGAGWAVLQAAVAGTLVHVVLGHSHGHDRQAEPQPGSWVAPVAGGAVGAAMLWLVHALDGHHVPIVAASLPLQAAVTLLLVLLPLIRRAVRSAAGR